MEQILLVYGLPKETVAAIMILYKNTKVKLRSQDGDTDYFDIVTGVLRGDTIAPYLFIISLDYMLRTSIDLMKENGFKLANERNRRYPAETITDAKYADDISASSKYTYPCRIPATKSGMSSRWHRPLSQLRQDRTHVLYSKRRHLHIKGWSYDTSGQVHPPGKQRLIN